jgi:hypothetical protein
MTSVVQQENECSNLTLGQIIQSLSPSIGQPDCYQHVPVRSGPLFYGMHWATYQVECCTSPDAFAWPRFIAVTGDGRCYSLIGNTHPICTVCHEKVGPAPLQLDPCSLNQHRLLQARRGLLHWAVYRALVEHNGIKIIERTDVNNYLYNMGTFIAEDEWKSAPIQLFIENFQIPKAGPRLLQRLRRDVEIGEAIIRQLNQSQWWREHSGHPSHPPYANFIFLQRAMPPSWNVRILYNS